MQVNQKNWSCPKKQKARYETIISQYRNAFSHSLPPKKQYWTMCGQCATSEGQPLEGCEPLQMINEGLITPEQFRGVEINPEIHDLNIKAFPELYFINQDFCRAMTQVQANNDFNPGIVNADFPATPDGGAAYISKLMSLLTATSKDVLFVANLILRMRYYTRKDGDYVLKLLQEYPQFRYAWEEGNWSMPKCYYEYNGAGETGSRIYMGTLVFVKAK